MLFARRATVRPRQLPPPAIPLSDVQLVIDETWCFEDAALGDKQISWVLPLNAASIDEAGRWVWTAGFATMLPTFPPLPSPLPATEDKFVTNVSLWRADGKEVLWQEDEMRGVGDFVESDCGITCKLDIEGYPGGYPIDDWFTDMTDRHDSVHVITKMIIEPQPDGSDKSPLTQGVRVEFAQFALADEHASDWEFCGNNHPDDPNDFASSTTASLTPQFVSAHVFPRLRWA